ncbi:MAG: hypothetical protein Q9169_005680 [Polycauliona sp. 2 TL-2023]
MSRRIYTQHLLSDSRQRAREARLAASSASLTSANADMTSQDHHFENELMEIVDRAKALIARIWETALIPLHALLSKPAQKAYLGTFLFATTSLFLLGLSTIAYSLFYFNYVPDPYSISLLLHLPRTPSNLAAGNFMLDLSLLAPAKASPSSTTTTEERLPAKQTIAHSRRPAIMTYNSPLINTASTLTGLPWYVLGWKTESEVLEVPMFEGVEFPRGWMNVPQEVRLVIEADEKMQFYEVGVRIFAKFGGLSAMISTLVAWLVLSSYLTQDATKVEKREPDSPRIKAEDSDEEKYERSLTEGLSDTSRTFPSLGRHGALQFTRREDGAYKGADEGVKQEDEYIQSTGLLPLAAEADDEDEGVETSGFRDSGIGTSLDESQRRRVQRRKRGSLLGDVQEDL